MSTFDYAKFTLPIELKNIEIGHVECFQYNKGSYRLKILVAKNEHCALYTVFDFYGTKLRETIHMVHYMDKESLVRSIYEGKYITMIENPHVDVLEITTLAEGEISVQNHILQISDLEQIEIQNYEIYKAYGKDIHTFRLYHTYTQETTETLYVIEENGETFLLSPRDKRVQQVLRHKELATQLTL